jgi:hypothetical protein
MFAVRRTSRARSAQRVAEDAWEHLLAAVESAGDTAKSAKKKSQNVADGMGSSVTAAADEARRRAGAALDALAGRRTRTHWEWVAGAVVAGLVVGWFAAAGARKATTEQEPAQAPEKDALDASVSPEY